MVAQRMGSQGGGGNSVGGTRTQIQTQTHDPKSNQLARQGSLYNLTLDEVQSQLGDLGKPLNSMNLDELLKTVFTAEGNNQMLESVEHGPSAQKLASDSKDLSKKTVDEVWNYIQEEQKQNSLDRNVTLGEMTLEDFLVKAGVVAQSSQGKKIPGSVIRGVDSIGQPQHTQWMNYPISSIPPPQQQQQSMMPVYMPGHSVQQPIPSIMENAYPDTQIMSSSPLMGTLSDSQASRQKRVAPDDIVEKSVERRQKRMIKNRESAARSRARKQVPLLESMCGSNIIDSLLWL